MLIPFCYYSPPFTFSFPTLKGGVINKTDFKIRNWKSLSPPFKVGYVGKTEFQSKITNPQSRIQKSKI